jgi:hypothetical protein
MLVVVIGTVALSLSDIFKSIRHIQTVCCREFVPQVDGGALGRRQHCQRWRLAEVLVMSGKNIKFEISCFFTVCVRLQFSI